MIFSIYFVIPILLIMKLSTPYCNNYTPILGLKEVNSNNFEPLGCIGHVTWNAFLYYIQIFSFLLYAYLTKFTYKIIVRYLEITYFILIDYKCIQRSSRWNFFSYKPHYFVLWFHFHSTHLSLEFWSKHWNSFSFAVPVLLASYLPLHMHTTCSMHSYVTINMIFPNHMDAYTPCIIEI